jgi:hypothetical protein
VTGWEGDVLREWKMGPEGWGTDSPDNEALKSGQRHPISATRRVELISSTDQEEGKQCDLFYYSAFRQFARNDITSHFCRLD